MLLCRRLRKLALRSFFTRPAAHAKFLQLNFLFGTNTCLKWLGARDPVGSLRQRVGAVLLRSSANALIKQQSLLSLLAMDAHQQSLPRRGLLLHRRSRGGTPDARPTKPYPRLRVAAPRRRRAGLTAHTAGDDANRRGAPPRPVLTAINSCAERFHLVSSTPRRCHRSVHQARLHRLKPLWA